MKILSFLVLLSFSWLFGTAQKVGIGTKAPTYFFTVKDSLSGTGGIGIAQVSPNGINAVGTYASNSSAYIQTHTATDLSFATNNGTAAMVLQNSTGRLGIATISPTSRLDVNGTATIRDTLKLTYGNPSAGQVLTCDAAGNARWANAAGGGFTLPFNGNASTSQTAFALSNDQGNGIISYTPGNNWALGGGTNIGIGVNATATSGIGINAYSGSGNAAVFQSGSGLAIKTLGGNVEINGSVKIVDGTQAANNVLTTDAAGNASWKVNANATVFSVTKSNNNNQTILPSSSTLVKINFNTGVLNQSGNAYNYSNSEFTAPANGFYHFDVTLTIVNSNTNSSLRDIFISLYKRDPSFPTGYMFYTHELTNTNGAVNSGNSHSLSTTIYLTQNDIIDVRVLNQSVTSITVLGQGAQTFFSYFSGYRVF